MALYLSDSTWQNWTSETSHTRIKTASNLQMKKNYPHAQERDRPWWIEPSNWQVQSSATTLDMSPKESSQPPRKRIKRLGFNPQNPEAPITRESSTIIGEISRNAGENQRIEKKPIGGNRTNSRVCAEHCRIESKTKTLPLIILSYNFLFCEKP